MQAKVKTKRPSDPLTAARGPTPPQSAAKTCRSVPPGLETPTTQPERAMETLGKVLIFDDQIDSPDVAKAVVEQARRRDLVLVRATETNVLTNAWDLIRQAAGDDCCALYLPGIDSLLVMRTAWFKRWIGIENN